MTDLYLRDYELYDIETALNHRAKRTGSIGPRAAVTEAAERIYEIVSKAYARTQPHEQETQEKVEASRASVLK